MNDSITTGFSPIAAGDTDEQLRSEVLGVYIWYIVRNFLEDYNELQPPMSPSEWMCQEGTVLDLLPRSGDEFANQLAGIMGLDLASAPLEKMRTLANHEIWRIGHGEQSDLIGVQAVFLVPEGTALAFERAMAA